MELPKEYDPQVAEPKWQKYWEEEKIFQFDPKDTKREIFSIDTPPPTVSGKMHLGHAFSYTQQDFIVRFQRMLGKNVFYPFGTDDNGLATERLIEKLKKVRSREMGRDKFVKLCLETLDKELRPAYIADWKRIGMSCQWDLFYTTINDHCQRISQRSFIDLYKKGREYRKEAPAMWCPECQTGISQVECQDKELDSWFNDIIFKIKSRDLIVATTRPELLAACVALFFHPSDKRYQGLEGKKAKVPLFGFEVPILTDERADPEKGTGLVMCCTFGDQTDMEWQKAYHLPIKSVLTPDGKMTKLAGKYAGMSIRKARLEIIEELKKENLLINQKPIKHAVNVHERCGTEIEFIHSKQWFIKYLDLKEEMLAWGAKLQWYPPHMKVRYDHWVKGLQWDWMISRQRFFGVPFPLWYCQKCEEVILAEEEQLPVDPLKDKPPINKCPKCNHYEFKPEEDVLDTWATSSLTPQLAVELIKEEKFRKKLYPMTLRPQAHDIITFWLFNTVVKSQLHFKVNPWQDVVISGHAQDPHGKKMSKSKGNIIEPQEMIKKYSADALRFWAAGSKLGDDLPFQEKDLVTGKKTIIKLWNASKFTLMHLEDFKEKDKPKLEIFDQWLISKLQKIIQACTETFERYEYSKTKAEAENFFWNTYCDFYLEIVKDRLYNSDKRGEEAKKAAQYTLYYSLLTNLKLFAPLMPHVTEEVYQLYFHKKENKKSLHLSHWPEFNQELVNEEAELAGDLGVDIINCVRKYKSENKLSLKEELKEIVLISEEENFEKLIQSIEEDLKAVLKVKEISFQGEASLESEKFAIKIGISD